MSKRGERSRCLGHARLLVDELVRALHRAGRNPCQRGPSRRPEVDVDVDEAEGVWRSLAEVGVDMDDVARVLEDEGVASFSKSFDELITALDVKRTEFG